MPVHLPSRLCTGAVATVLLTAIAGTGVALAPSGAAATGEQTPVAPAVAAITSTQTPRATTTVGTLELKNSFVSSVGWVKPGDTYPSRLILTNTGDAPVLGATVTATAPEGSTFVGHSAPAGTTASRGASTVTWTVPTLAAKATTSLVLESKAATLAALPTIVWRDLSTTATLTVDGTSDAVASHGPKVIPPSGAYDTARYGDRPFPVVPVAYSDRDFQPEHTGDSLDRVINDPETPGSTFNLFQEMSLGQLFPHGAVPSAGISAAEWGDTSRFEFSTLAEGLAANPNTCLGTTAADSPVPAYGTPLLPNRIENGVYQLPGMTGYYGSDGAGSALIGAQAGVSALMQIDSGCGPTAKLVKDAATISDPEIDYSDFDTDKDGLVDFFMVVYAGCGGHGASQLTIAGCAYTDLPYDNVWPHSSSLEYTYSDPVTGKPGFATDDQLKDNEGRPLWYTDDSYTEMTTTPGPDALKVYVRVGPYNVNPEDALDHASVISHEYGHSLGLPDFYSLGSRETYGTWNLMASDHSQHMDSFSRQELGWVVPQVLTGDRTATGVRDSKKDINTITWQTPDGTPYTLVEGRDGVGRVQNSEMYAARLPGRILLEESRMEGASGTHTWWSNSGNDFGCITDGGGHNLSFLVPGAAALEEGTTLTLSMKSMFDIEWDFDYGFVVTSQDGGQTFRSHPSLRSQQAGGPTTTATANPNQNACQAALGNGITGSSASYADPLTPQADRLLGNYPQATWVEDSFDISDIAGDTDGFFALSYSTDPGLARPGWFIDDLKVTATHPDGTTEELLVTDFESDGGPDDPRTFNGLCQGDAPGGKCTQGWTFVEAGGEADYDHAYYLEMRDRSGFDLDGRGQSDRGPVTWSPGFYAAYTDEAHGYGNVGTDNPPAQTPLDSQPEPGTDTPDLDDAAWTAADGDDRFTDWDGSHVENYSGPSGDWVFDFDCLSFEVTRMSGETDNTENGDLTGDVAFDLGDRCGTWNYGYVDDPAGPNTAPTAAFTHTVAADGTVTLDASPTTDAETPDDLDYSWDLGDGGSTKDAAGRRVTHDYAPGTYTVTLTVTDPMGLTDTHAVEVTVGAGATPTPTPTTGAGAETSANTAPVARLKATPRKPRTGTWIRLSGLSSRDAQTPGSALTYTWRFQKRTASGPTVRVRFLRPGWHTVTLTVTDPEGLSTTTRKRIWIRRR